MREVEVGLRIDPETGIVPFGTDEANELIRHGGRVIAFEPGGAIMRKLGEDSDNVRLTLVGFSIKVQFEEAADA